MMELCLASSHAPATIRETGASWGTADSEQQRLTYPDYPSMHLSGKSGVVQNFPHQTKVTQGHFFCTYTICLSVDCLGIYLAPVSLINRHSL